MPMAERNKAMKPNVIDNSIGDRRVTSERAVRSAIVCTPNTGSSRSRRATSPRTDVAIDDGARLVRTANVRPRRGVCAWGV